MAGMFGFTCSICFVAGNINKLEDAVGSVFSGADPSWVVRVVGQQHSSACAVNAAPVDGPNFHGELPRERQTPEGLAEMLQVFYNQYQASLLHA
jgi:hypothetical protein